MKAKFKPEHLPTVQELIIGCDAQGLENEILCRFSRRNERVRNAVKRAISEMGALNCDSPCEEFYSRKEAWSRGEVHSREPCETRKAGGDFAQRHASGAFSQCDTRGNSRASSKQRNAGGGAGNFFDATFSVSAGVRSVIVVPRQRFITLGNNIYIRRVQAEYLDAARPRVLTSAVCGHGWQTVLQYGVWNRASLSARDMLQMIADVCFSMLACGACAGDASKNAYLNAGNCEACATWQSDTHNAQANACSNKERGGAYCNISAGDNLKTNSKGGDADYWQDACVGAFNFLEDFALLNFEQAAITFGWLKILNDRADDMFITEAKRLQKYLDGVA